jgi:hypothetical protein
MIGKKFAVVGHEELLNIPIEIGRVDVSTHHVVREKNRLGVDLLQESAEHLYFAVATIAIDGSPMAPTETDFPLFIIDTEFGFRYIEVVELIALEFLQYVECHITCKLQVLVVELTFVVGF